MSAYYIVRHIKPSREYDS